MNNTVVPISWSIATVGDVCKKIANGGNFNQKDSAQGLPVTRIETISFEKVDLTRVKYCNDYSESDIEKYGLQTGDILFSHINSDIHLGKTAVFKEKNKVVLHGINLLRIQTNKAIIPEFLNLVFKHLRFKGEFVGIAQKAVNQSSINQKRLKQVEIPVPPVTEQYRIIAKIEELFSELDKGVESLKVAQQQLKAYRQAVLKSAFEGKLTEEWRTTHRNLSLLKDIEQVQLENCVEIKHSGKKIKPFAVPITNEELAQLPSLPNEWKWNRLGILDVEVFDGPFGSNLKSSDYVECGVQVIRLENIGPLKFIGDKKSYISEEKYELLKNHNVSAGDIIFASFITDETRVVILPDTIKRAINKADCFCIRVKGKNINRKYLNFFLSSRQAYNSLKDKIHGVGRPRINTSQLKELTIPLCSPTEQNIVIEEIESRLSICDKMEETIAQSLSQAEVLRQSLLKKAFEGQLVPQDPKDEPVEKLLERISAVLEKPQHVEKPLQRRTKK